MPKTPPEKTGALRARRAEHAAFEKAASAAGQRYRETVSRWRKLKKQDKRDVLAIIAQDAAILRSNLPSAQAESLAVALGNAAALLEEMA